MSSTGTHLMAFIMAESALRARRSSPAWRHLTPLLQDVSLHGFKNEQSQIDRSQGKLTLAELLTVI